MSKLYRPPKGIEPTFFFEEIGLSLSSHITESVKRLSKGMSCIKNIIHKYGHDKEKVEKIYQAIDDIFKAQNIANTCAAMVVTVTELLFHPKMAHLFNLEHKHINIGQKDFVRHPNFIYDEKNNDRIVGIMYEDNDTGLPLVAFEVYASCQHSYKNVLHSRAMEIQLLLAQLNRCSNKMHPNKYAGNTSMASEFEDINFNTKGEQIGVNLGTRIRPDKRTNNNYLLNWGFGLGNITTRENDKIVLPYPKYFNDAFFDEMISKLSIASMFDPVRKMLEKIRTPKQDYRPYANLHSVILYGNDFDKAVGALENKIRIYSLLEYLKSFQSTDKPLISANGLYQCVNLICKCVDQTVCPVLQKYQQARLN